MRKKLLIELFIYSIILIVGIITMFVCKPPKRKHIVPKPIKLQKQIDQVRT